MLINMQQSFSRENEAVDAVRRKERCSITDVRFREKRTGEDER